MDHTDANSWTIRPPERTSWRSDLGLVPLADDTSSGRPGVKASLTRISWAKALVAQLIARG